MSGMNGPKSLVDALGPKLGEGIGGGGGKEVFFPAVTSD